MPKTNEDLTVKYMVKARNHEPTIILCWGEMRSQLTTAEARSHALSVLLVTEAAERDRLLYQAMTKGGMSLKDTEAFIKEIFSPRIESSLETPDEPDEPEQLYMTSIYTGLTEEGYILLLWRHQQATLSVEAARAHAFEVFSKAAIAEADAVTHRWFMQQLDIDSQKAAVVLRELRNFRDPNWLKQVHTIADNSDL